MTPRAASPPVTRDELHGELKALLKWVITVGLGLAFAAGAWATTVKAEVAQAQARIAEMNENGPLYGQRLSRQVDSLRYEMRAMREKQDEIITLLKEVRRGR